MLLRTKIEYCVDQRVRLIIPLTDKGVDSMGSGTEFLQNKRDSSVSVVVNDRDHSVDRG